MIIYKGNGLISSEGNSDKYEVIKMKMTSKFNVNLEQKQLWNTEGILHSKFVLLKTGTGRPVTECYG